MVGTIVLSHKIKICKFIPYKILTCDNHIDIAILNTQITFTKNSNVPYVMHQEGNIKKSYFWTTTFRFVCNSILYFEKPYFYTNEMVLIEHLF